MSLDVNEQFPTKLVLEKCPHKSRGRGRKVVLHNKLFLRLVVVCQNTDGYSGSDIQLVCKESAMRPVRKIFDFLESHYRGERSGNEHVSVNVTSR